MSEWTPVEGAAPPLGELVLDLDLLGELTHPTRSALLHRLTTPQSAAELAQRLGVPVTRLYHHLNRLEELGLIEVDATRRSGSKVERRYRTVARRFRLDTKVERHRSTTETANDLGAVFDLAKHDLEREITLGTIRPGAPESEVTLALLELVLRPDQHAVFVERLRDLIDELADLDEGAADGDGTRRVRLLIAGFPLSG